MIIKTNKLWLLVSFASFFCLTSISVLIKLLPHSIPLIQIASIQFILAFIFNMPFVLRKSKNIGLPGGLNNLKTTHYLAHLFRSIGGVIAYLLFFAAIFNTSVVQANLLLSSAPIWATLFACIFFHKNINSLLITALIVGFIGVVVALHLHQFKINMGDIYGLLAGIMFAIAILASGQMSKTDPPVRQIFYFALAGAIICGGYSLFHWHPLSIMGWIILLAVGVLFILQQAFMVIALRHIHAIHFTPFNYTNPITAAVLAWIIWAYIPSIYTIIGTILICISGYLIYRISSKEQESGPA